MGSKFVYDKSINTIINSLIKPKPYLLVLFISRTWISLGFFFFLVLGKDQSFSITNEAKHDDRLRWIIEFVKTLNHKVYGWSDWSLSPQKHRALMNEGSLILPGFSWLVLLLSPPILILFINLLYLSNTRYCWSLHRLSTIKIQ